MDEKIFENLSRAAQEQLLIQEEILQGKYGRPGSVFMTTRALAEKRQVSVVTAHHILCGLCSSGYLELRGKKYYLSHAELIEERNTGKNLIGMIFPRIDDEFHSSLANAVITVAKQKGYTVLTLTTSYSDEEEEKALKLLLHFGVSGIINCTPTSKENAYLYRDLSIPCVLLGFSLDNCKKSSVQVNSFPISQKVARHLMNEGYQKFLYIGTKNLSLEKDIRFTAFQMELRQNGYSLAEEDTIQISQNSKSDVNQVIQLLEKQSQPVGVFCYHDLIASCVYRACNILEKRIPEDVGVVGFDDLSFASTLIPPLSSVQYRITSMADMTISLLLSAFDRSKVPYDNYYVDPNLVVRDSSRLSLLRKT